MRRQGPRRADRPEKVGANDMGPQHRSGRVTEALSPRGVDTLREDEVQPNHCRCSPDGWGAVASEGSGSRSRPSGACLRTDDRGRDSRSVPGPARLSPRQQGGRSCFACPRTVSNSPFGATVGPTLSLGPWMWRLGPSKVAAELSRYHLRRDLKRLRPLRAITECDSHKWWPVGTDTGSRGRRAYHRSWRSLAR